MAAPATTLFSAETLTRATTDVFRAAGTPDDVATVLVDALVDANLAGHDSHGVIHVPTYVQAIRDGTIVPDARPEVVEEGVAIVRLDGGWGFGHYAAHVAMGLAADKAKRGQLALVAVTRVGHIGRLGGWAEQAARSGVVGMIATSFGGGPFAATPFGGVGKVLSTNPIAFGVPRRGAPLVLDFATTAVAEGKIRVARAKGVPVPEGYIVDREGRPTTTPDDFYEGGMLLPFGGHKGFALAMVVEMLSIALTGADAAPHDSGRFNGAVFLAIDPSALRPLDDFVGAVEAINGRVAGVPPAPGSDGVLIPGQPEERSRERRLREGIPLPDTTWQAIQETARELGVTIRA